VFIERVEAFFLRFVCETSIQNQDRCTDFEVRFCCSLDETDQPNHSPCNDKVTTKENLKKLEKVNLRNFIRNYPADIL